jgi:formylglycine-generating enzyme required for sulfatase activity
MFKNKMFRNMLIGSMCFIVTLALIYQFADLSAFDIKPQQSATACLETSKMVKIKGGVFRMGAGAVYREELPIVETRVDDFYIDSHEVTNAQFAEFVAATGYITLAEKVPSAKDYPNIPIEYLKAGSAVFVKLIEAVKAANITNWWQFTEGANWRNPLGPNSTIEGRENFPVIHIAYEDALAYAKWKGNRLPSEAEYEYASRGGLDNAKYASGNSLTENGRYIANTWQGLFPFTDTAEDGYVGLAPVGCYPPNAYGVYDLIGNVWEWTDSVYYPRHFETSNLPPNLPPQGYDAQQPGVSVKVIKGGSYLCASDFCMRYRPAARHAQDTGLGTSHIGFRTAR